MNPSQSQIVEKVRMSGCLSAEELRAFEEFSESWETRQQVHQWDQWWAGEVPNHIICVKTNGVRTYHLPTSGQSKVTLGLGVFCILFGISGAIPLVPMGLVMAGLGVLVMFRAKKDKGGWQAYEGARQTYYDGRKAALQSLPQEFHPAGRICLRCVKAIE
ncbi:hypothetical protein [Prosthecobacter sp.]|uniref:hypothetical protein n=1 Tax=Prosthecobacter sp. TaxID=1965333 RepID=UPI0037834F78